LICSIDIGGTMVKYGVITQTGKIVEKSLVKNNAYSKDSLIEILRRVIDEMREKYLIEGIAFTIPAITDSNTGEVLSEGSMPFLLGENVKEALKKHYNLPIHSENDGNCAALAEAWIGAGQGKSDLAVVVIGTGVGGAVLKDGRIHSGNNFLAGEFGYMFQTFDFESKKFESWSDCGSVLTLSDKMSQHLNREVSGKEVFTLAESGDAYACGLIDDFYNSNAIGFFNIQYMYDPEVIIIGGGVSERQDFLIELEKRMDLIFECNPIATKRPILEKTMYGNDANLIGAAYHFIQHEAITN